MTRLTKRRTPDDDEYDDASSQGSAFPNQQAKRSNYQTSHESSPSASFSSDKENRASSLRRTLEKGKAPLSAQEGPNKRRKLSEGSALEPSQAAFQRVKEGVDNKRFYDPEQPLSERRAVRKGIRDLAKELSNSRNEYLSSTSTGLKATLERANQLFAGVKQTSDATLDSRLLVTAGDLTARRAIENKLGGVTTGIDVDEFVGKCMAFMRKGPSEREAAALSLSQPARRQQHHHNTTDSSDASGAEDEDEAYDWEWLGRKACFPHNARPPVANFLLGPLSVQKKIRKVTQRSQRQKKPNPAEAVRPEEICLTDVNKKENANLTELCRKIYKLLDEYHAPRLAQAEAEIEERGEDVTEEDAFEILAQHGLRSNTGVCFYEFAFNPKSFGQTVENLFYISFLIRDGVAGLHTDNNGYLTIHPASTLSPEEIRKHGIRKRQAVFHLDFETWRDVVEEFEIKKCIIPHRRSEREQEREVGEKGWYC